MNNGAHAKFIQQYHLHSFAYKHIIEPTNEQASVRWNKMFALTYTPTDSKLYIY